MPTAHRTPTIGVTRRLPFETDADLVIGAVFEDDSPAGLTVLHTATGGEVERAWQRGEFKGKLFETLVTPTGTAGQRAILIGAGLRKDLTTDRVRRMAIVGGLAARSRRVTRVAFGGWDRVADAMLTQAPGRQDAAEAVTQACAEGIVLANFEGGNYKTDDSLRHIAICSMSIPISSTPT